MKAYCLYLSGILLCAGLAQASFPHHVNRSLLSPAVHDKQAMYSEHHVDYSDPSAGWHVKLHYQAQQHLEVTTWNLDDFADLTCAVIKAGEVSFQTTEQ